MVGTRRDRHATVSSSLAARGDDELAALVSAAPAGSLGVGGGTSMITIDEIPVFIKRIPITARELAHPHSTANLFDLPISCQYGMHRLASPGFGAWRELAANLDVTQGVLDGESESCAVLHHWRVIPGRPPIAAEHHDIEAIVAQFGGEQSVRARLRELADATSSLVLFLEYFPDGLLDRLEPTVDGAQLLERQLFEAVAFLRHRGVLHMDGHFGNLRAGADQIHLVDFGLATSPQFELSDVERDFVSHHVTHDADYAAMRLVNWLVTTMCGVPTPTGADVAERNTYVRRCARGDIPREVPDVVADILARHAPAAAGMNDFFCRLFAGDVNAQYPEADAPPAR